MSKSPPNQMQVTIFNKEYRIACPEGQEKKLIEATDFLNQRVKGMRESSSGLSTEQAVMITALNLAHELLELRREEQRRGGSGDEIRRRLQAIKERLDTNLFQQTPKPGHLYQF